MFPLHVFQVPIMQPHNKRAILLILYMNVNEKAVMIVSRTLAYKRRNSVARTGTAFLPLSLAAVVEYRLRTMMPVTNSQM